MARTMKAATFKRNSVRFFFVHLVGTSSALLFDLDTFGYILWIHSSSIQRIDGADGRRLFSVQHLDVFTMCTMCISMVHISMCVSHWSTPYLSDIRRTLFHVVFTSRAVQRGERLRSFYWAINFHFEYKSERRSIQAPGTVLPFGPFGRIRKIYLPRRARTRPASDRPICDHREARDNGRNTQTRKRCLVHQFQ